MKSFYQYLSELKKEYKYKLKLAVPVTDEMMDSLENILKRYDAIDVSRPKKSILQHNEIDFPGIGPVESYTINIVTERPLITQSLVSALQSGLNVSERFIRIRGENEPVTVEQRFQDEVARINDKAEDEGLEETSLLGTEELPVSDLPQAYGNDYNQSLLNYLAQLQANRAEEEDAKTPHKTMFGWLNDQKARADDAFISDHSGVKPVSGSLLKAKENPEAPVPVANTGNFDSSIAYASKTFKDKGGKTKKLSDKGE